jgi:hypothetical protein
MTRPSSALKKRGNFPPRPSSRFPSTADSRLIYRAIDAWLWIQDIRDKMATQRVDRLGAKPSAKTASAIGWRCAR